MRWIIISKDNDVKGVGYYVDLGSTTLENEDSETIGFSKNNKVAYLVAYKYSIKYNGLINAKKYIINNK